MALSKQDDRAGWDGQTAWRETWAEFDGLPRGVKRLFWEAPYLYTAIDAVEAHRGGRDMRSFTLQQLELTRQDVRREVRRIYGPTHPQARSGAW